MSTYVLVGGLRQGSPERRVVAAAMAPAVHSVQAWRFRVVPGLIEIRADIARFRTMTDPRARRARSVHLSSGAALFNLRLAAAQLGREPVVRLLPDHSRPGLLGTLRLAGPHRTTPFERRLYAATLKPAQVRQSATAPPPLTAAGTPGPRTAELAEAARLEGATLRRVPQAERVDEPGIESWLLSTPGDGPMAWLRAGQALQRVLLTAAAQSISVSFRDETSYETNHETSYKTRYETRYESPDRAQGEIPEATRPADEVGQAEHGETPQALIRLGQAI